MWLFTKHGFYSATVSKEQPDKIQIRARLRRDLENLLALMAQSEQPAPLPEILETPLADYRWRVIVSRDVFALLMMDFAYGVDYSNFKGKIAATPDQKDKEPDLHRVWSIHHGWQERERHARPAKRKVGRRRRRSGPDCDVCGGSHESRYCPRMSEDVPF